MQGFHPTLRNDQEICQNRRPEYGLAIYVKNKFEMISNVNRSIESQMLNVRKSQTNDIYTVLVIYKAPVCSLADFKAHMLSLYIEFRFSKNLIIVGDFNFDISDDETTTS